MDRELARDEEARLAHIDGADLAAAILVGAQLEPSAPNRAALVGGQQHLKERIARLLAPIAVDEAPRSPALPALTVAPLCLVSAAGGAWCGEALIQLMLQVLP